MEKEDDSLLLGPGPLATLTGTARLDVHRRRIPLRGSHALSRSPRTDRLSTATGARPRRWPRRTRSRTMVAPSSRRTASSCTLPPHGPAGMGRTTSGWPSDPTRRRPWGRCRTLGTAINSADNEFCPTPLDGGWLLFVSDRAACGATPNLAPPVGDIYITRQRHDGTWKTPQHLGCVADGSGPNFTGGEFGPSLVSDRRRDVSVLLEHGNDREPRHLPKPPERRRHVRDAAGRDGAQHGGRRSDAQRQRRWQ